MQIVILDGYTLNPGDIDWAPVQVLGSTQIYDRTPPEVFLERASNAEILVVNKFQLSGEMIRQLKQLRCICVSATGYNNVDIQSAKKLGIPVLNVAGYSTTSVAQQVFAFALSFFNRVDEHNRSVHQGQWASAPDFTYSLYPIQELQGKTMGIYGFGRIGQEVARLAEAFRMRIIATHKHPERDARPGVEFVDLDRLFTQSDILSLHAPLSKQNQGIVDARRLQSMKKTALLINTGRGGLVNEGDLKRALEEGWIKGAALDVLSAEPPPADHPLIGLENCLITPHQAWASREARERLMDLLAGNISGFLKGELRNWVNE